jgi:hypothetical protein
MCPNEFSTKTVISALSANAAVQIAKNIDICQYTLYSSFETNNVLFNNSSLNCPIPLFIFEGSRGRKIISLSNVA